jgi:hypothetical protein
MDSNSVEHDEILPLLEQTMGPLSPHPMVSQQPRVPPASGCSCCSCTLALCAEKHVGDTFSQQLLVEICTNDINTH